MADGLCLLEERVDEGRERHLGIDVMAERHGAVAGEHDRAPVDQLLGDAEIHVAEHDAKHEERVRAFDRRAYRVVAGKAQIGADERGVGAGQKAAGEKVVAAGMPSRRARSLTLLSSP